MQRSSAGSELAVHLTRSSGSERNSVRAMSGRSVMPAASKNFFHVANRACLQFTRGQIHHLPGFPVPIYLCEMFCVFCFGTMHADRVQNKTNDTSHTSGWEPRYSKDSRNKTSEIE